MVFRERSGEGQSPFWFDMALPIPGHLSTGVSTHLSTQIWYWHDDEVSWFCGPNRGRSIEEPGIQRVTSDVNRNCFGQSISVSKLPRPIKIRPWMYVRRSIMYEKAAFCSPEEYSSVAR